MGQYNPQIDVESIQAKASAADSSTRFLLLTTLTRYQMQMKMLQDLQNDIVSHGTLSACRTGNSVTEYGRVAAASNSTAKTLSALLKSIDTPVIFDSEQDDDDEL